MASQVSRKLTPDAENEGKSAVLWVNISRKESCLQVKLNNVVIPESNDVKYLGMHFDKRFT